MNRLQRITEENLLGIGQLRVRIKVYLEMRP
jgi:hypothetical protein